jgi:hypothetical protein
MFNMELDPQSLFGFHVHSCTHWLRPCNPLKIWAHIRGRYLSTKKDDIFLCPSDKNISAFCLPLTRLKHDTVNEKYPKFITNLSLNFRSFQTHFKGI